MYEEYDDEDDEMEDLELIQGKTVVGKADLGSGSSSKELSSNKVSSSKELSSNKVSTQDVSSSSKPPKTMRTVVIDYGEHHRKSMREQRPLPLIDTGSWKASDEDNNSMQMGVNLSPSHHKRSASRRSSNFPELAEEISLSKQKSVRPSLFKDEYFSAGNQQEDEFF